MSKQQENQNPSSKDVDNGIFDEQYIKMFEVKLPENIKGVIINFQIIVDEIFKADINERRLQKVKKRLEFSKIENRIIAISPIFIALVDFFLAGIVFSQLSKAVPIPRFDNNFDDLVDFLIIALITVMIVWLELFMGLLSHKKETNNNSNYLTILSKIFVFIIPIIAFSEGFKELALLPQKFKASDTPYSENSLNAGYLAICLKYFGLALMSFITHSFLVFKAIPIVENFSLFWYEKYLIGNTDLDKNNPLDKQIFDLRRKILVYYYRLQLYEDWVRYELTKETDEEVNENLEDNFDDGIDESQEIEDKSSQKRNEFVFKSIENLRDKLSQRITSIIQDYQTTDTLKT